MAGVPTSVVRITSYKKTEGAGSGASYAYGHNTTERPENADPELFYLNEELMEDRTHGKSVDDYIDEQLYELRSCGAMTRSLQSNAVGTIEVVMNADNVYLKDGIPPQDFDLDGWKKASIEWADRTFNPPNHEITYTDKNGGEQKRKVQNIYSAVLHRDESSPHIHVLLMPIDDRGHLNSKYYRTLDRFVGKEGYVNSYYEAVKQYGLARGQEGSPSRAKTIRNYHDNIEKAMSKEAPVPVPGERIEDYRNRVTEELQLCYSHMNDQDRRHELEMNQEIGKRRTLMRESGAFKKEITEALGLEPEKEIDLERVRDISEKAKKQEDFEKAVQSYPDRSAAEELEAQVNQIIRWQKEREKEETRDRHKTLR